MRDWEQEVGPLAAGHHRELLEKVGALRHDRTVYPPEGQEFHALELTPFREVEVVILGQDPYHGPGQAQGLAFSVPDGVPAPPSLRNIFKEISADVYDGEKKAFSNDLSRWARQGVLLLNTSLSVEAGKAGSHSRLGWVALTDAIIAALSEKREHLVFILWGRHAQAKEALIDAGRHLVLKAAHPSPLSARHGFFGCRHFSRANEYLERHGRTPVDW